MKRIVLRTKNFVYVYYSGNYGDIVFMGITNEEYENSKGVYHVSGFVHSNMGLDADLKLIELEFELNANLRYIPEDVPKEQAIACIKEFYAEGLDEKFSDLKKYEYIIDKTTWRGIQVKGIDKSDLEFLVHHVNLENSIVQNKVVDFSELAKDDVEFRKPIPFTEFVKKVVHKGNSSYVYIEVLEREDTTILFSIINLDRAEVSFGDSSIFSEEPNYKFNFKEERFIMIQ